MDTEPFESAFREATALVAARQFQQAEAVLQRLRQRESVPSHVDLIMLELTNLYCLMEPPDFAKAEAPSLERERVSRTACSKYATAMMYHSSMVNVPRTLAKVSEAIDQAQKMATIRPSTRHFHSKGWLFSTVVVRVMRFRYWMRLLQWCASAGSLS
jgi:hypothetical protein